MKTIAISRRSKQLNALLEQAHHENLILRSPAGSEFILAELDDFDREIALTRKNKRLMAFLNQRGRETKTIPLAEAKVRLGLET